MPVQSLIKSALIDIVANEPSGSTEDKDRVQDSHVYILVSLVPGKKENKLSKSPGTFLRP